MDPVVYVSDLDGTLLRRDARLDPACLTELTRLLEAGEHFTVASARSIVSIRRILEGLPVTLPVVAQNGAMVCDLATGDAHVVLSPPERAVREAYEIACSVGLEPVVACWDGEAERLYHPPGASGGVGNYLADLRRYADPRPRAVKDVAAHLGEAVVCLTCIGSAAVVLEAHARIVAAIGHEAHVVVMRSAYDPDFRWLTLHALDATKGVAVTKMLEHSGLSGAEVVGIGDETWDATLFDVSRRRVAVANAAPEILAAATEVIGHHDDGAVARWIAADVLRRRQS